MKSVAPNLNLWLYRPAIANPPLCSFLECERATLDQIADMNEALDLRAATSAAMAANRDHR